MKLFFAYKLLSVLSLGFFIGSCSDSKSDDYSAYFGGEVINPKDNWVFFYKGDKLIDSIAIDKDNRFFIKFDSLSPGLYTFKHEPEYQYVYFDKNDSLMVRVNTTNFDESLVFCGKGDEKNNFLVEMYLKNHKDRNEMFNSIDLDETDFVKKADSSYQSIKKFYTSKKEEILWNDDFDQIAKASVDYPYYTKKEFYPVAHKRRKTTGEQKNISNEFYNYRKNIDFNNENLIDFSPYIQYINTTIDNIANTKNVGFLSDSKTSLKKLEIVDTITKNQLLKNKIANNITFRYLMEKEENANDNVFLEKYYTISTDSEKKVKVKELVESIQNLSTSGYLPEIKLINLENEEVLSNGLFHKKTILYFWSKKNEGHFFAVHKKLNRIIEKHPDIDIIAVNLDADYNQWKSFLDKYKTIPNPKIKHFQVSNLEELKDKWIVTRETRASIIDKNGKVINGFVNIFSTTFDKQL